LTVLTLSDDVLEADFTPVPLLSDAVVDHAAGEGAAALVRIGANISAGAGRQPEHWAVRAG
jgi:hypothetical protein